jgi:hypothetical protein
LRSLGDAGSLKQRVSSSLENCSIAHRHIESQLGALPLPQ